MYRAVDGKFELLFVQFEVVGDRHRCRHLFGVCTGGFREGHSREVMDAVDGAQCQARPTELPRPARTGRMIEHHEPRFGLDSELAQVVRGGESGLSGADHHHVNRVWLLCGKVVCTHR